MSDDSMLTDPDLNFNYDYSLRDPSDMCSERLEKLKDFCLQQLRALVSMEEEETQCRSTIRHFVRLDVGIIRNSGGSFEYFVNEVTRMPDMFLFSCRNDGQLELLRLAGQLAMRSILSCIYSHKSNQK